MENNNVNNQTEDKKVSLDTEKVYNVNALTNNKSIRRSMDDVTTMAGEYVNTSNDNIFDDLLKIPNWSFEDFYKERTKFRRQGLDGNDTSPYNDRGSFFYKLFFNFSSNFGLLGSLIHTSTSKYAKDINTAYMYLSNNIEGDKFSEKYKNVLRAKRSSLESFGKILNYLQMECPWFFKEVGGLAEVTKRNFNEIVPAEEKQITLTFNPDAVDMRISTLLDLYVNACYDTINFKEVIPENLRKFDMSIIIFNPPIANLNVPYTYMSTQELEKAYQRAKEKSMANIGFQTDLGADESDFSKSMNNWAGILKERMSFKCIILKNCEIDLNNLTTTPEVLSTEEPLSLEYTINIKYQRSYIYNLNKPLSIELLDNMYNELSFNDYDDFTDVLEKKYDKEKEEIRKELVNSVSIPDQIEVVEEEVEEEELPSIAEIGEVEEVEELIDEIEEEYDLDSLSDVYDGTEEVDEETIEEIDEKLDKKNIRYFTGNGREEYYAITSCREEAYYSGYTKALPNTGKVISKTYENGRTGYVCTMGFERGEDNGYYDDESEA